MRNKEKLQWDAKSRGGEFGYRFFIFIIKYLGVRFAYFNLAFIVIHFIPFAPKSTRALWYYYRRIWHCGRFRSAVNLYLHYFRFGQCLIDRFAVFCGQSAVFRYEFGSEYDTLLSLLNSGRGVIMIGAHIGAWEIGAQFFKPYADRMNIIMYDNEHDKIKKTIEKNQGRRPYSIIPINNTDPLSSVLLIKQKLSNGEFICMQGDRFLTSEHTLSTDFLGQPALFPEGPFLLGARFKVPVVFYFALKTRSGYRFEFRIIDNPPKDPAALLDIYKAELEKHITANRSQWFNLYQFWQKK